MKREIGIALVLSMTWIVMILATRAMVSGISSVGPVSLVAAWWSVAYLSTHFRAGWLSALIVGLGVFCVSFMLFLSGSGIHYHDAPQSTVHQAVLALLHGLVSTTPVVADIAFRWVKGKFWRDRD